MTDINVPPRAFQVDDDVVCLNCGIGKVTSNTGLYGFPIKVKFNNSKEEYTANGQFFPNSKRCLFHADEYVQVTVKVNVTEPVRHKMQNLESRIDALEELIKHPLLHADKI